MMSFAKSRTNNICKISVLKNKSYFHFILWSSLRKTIDICQWTNHEGAVVYGSSWKPVDDEEFKIFCGEIILIGVYKSNNENLAQL